MLAVNNKYVQLSLKKYTRNLKTSTIRTLYKNTKNSTAY